MALHGTRCHSKILNQNKYHMQTEKGLIHQSEPINPLLKNPSTVTSSQTEILPKDV